ncbi:MAG TPA: hypothetical protein VHT04_02660, partial [Stellaceae bacterium]|nr:hypothetical protein [Stellaceae bacterium]
PAFAADDGQIAGSIRRDPESVAAWRGDLAPDRPIVVYCVHGHEVSQGVAAVLREAGRSGSTARPTGDAASHRKQQHVVADQRRRGPSDIRHVG